MALDADTRLALNGHHARFLMRASSALRIPEDTRIHAAAGAVAWLGLTSILSHVPLPGPAIPLLGANLGAAWTAASVVYWLPADALVAACVALLTVAWATAPFTPWGPGHGWLAGVAAPLALLAAAGATAWLARIYHHERGAFLRGEPASTALIGKAYLAAFAPFIYGLLALLDAGYRPELRAELHEREREHRLRRNLPWANWAKIASSEALVACMPDTVDELVEAVVAARARGHRIRVVGSGFSWSSLVPTNETLLFCERLDRVEVDLDDPERPAVWVEAGVTNRKLNLELARHGLCMPWNVVLETVRVAGIASTGTHGTGRETATVGDLVDVYEVIDAAGKRRVLSEETLGVEGMNAARVNLGLFGVITRIRLRVAPLYRVRQTDTRVPVSEMLADLPRLLREHASVELYWFPFNTDVWMRTVDPTDAPRTFQGHGAWFKAQNLMQNAWLVATSELALRLAPKVTPALLRFSMRMLPFRTRVLDLPESHHYHHWIEVTRCGCMEVGFKADADGANVRRAWEATERLVEAYAKRGLYPLNVTLNVRFTGGSGALLTPAHGDGLTAFVEIMWSGRPEGWREFSSDLCREWMKEPGALPHWSKEFEHVEDVVALVRENLGDRRARFLTALASSGIDPERCFANDMIHRVFLDG